MSKVDIKRLDSITKNDTTATEQINDNFLALQQAIENTVSRDGTAPNYMDADLDLNSYRIINAGAPVNGKDVVTLEYFEEKAGGAIEAAAEAKASASQAASSAQSALVASNNAIGQLSQAEALLLSAEGQLQETQQFVTDAKVEIENTKNTAIATIESTVAVGTQEINTTIDEASMRLSDTIEQSIEDVKAEATAAANEAIQSAADEATQIALNQTTAYVENTAIPNITAVKDSAVSELESVLAADKSTLESYVQVASDSMAISTQRASEAAESARVAGEKVNQIEGVVDDVNAAAASASASAIRSENSAVRAEEAEQRIMESGALPSQAGNEGKFLTTDGTEASWADVGGGLEIGDIGFAPLGIDEAQNKRRYLNGQVISQVQFVSFTNKIKEAVALYPNIATTEGNWQAEVTNSKLGQCGKFVIDNNAGTIRLPKVININGLQDLALIGSIKSESLPNIKGNFGNTISQNDSDSATGGAFAIGADWDSDKSGTGSGLKGQQYSFDASRSSSTYQDNAPVQQEAIQYPYFIQVATGVETSIDVTREIELNNPFSLLDYKWSEYEITNASWLISNGAFHSGATYPSVYELLLKIHNGTETKDGVSVKLSTETYTDTDFVLNTADTTFRLPIKVKLASGNAVVGNGMTLGLTDGTSDFGLQLGIYNNNQGLGISSSSYGVDIGTANGAAAGGSKTFGVTTDPTKSGLVLADNDMYLYFYVGETIQDANVIAASQVLSAIPNKANINLSNVTNVAQSFKNASVGWGMPDYSTVITGLSRPFTAPTDGLISWNNAGTSHCTINGNTFYLGGDDASNEGNVTLLLSKNDVISFSPNSGTPCFVSLKGVN